MNDNNQEAELPKSAKLTECIHCHCQVSPRATQCPKCHKALIQQIDCEDCSKFYGIDQKTCPHCGAPASKSQRARVAWEESAGKRKKSFERLKKDIIFGIFAILGIFVASLIIAEILTKDL